MIDIKEILSKIAVERPVGTEANEEVIGYIEGIFKGDGYKTESIPFECLRWYEGQCELKIGNSKFEVYGSPFSQRFKGKRETVLISTLEELKSAQLKGKILLLYGELSKGSIQPKNYPFYYPPEHEELISLLESKNPCAIISFTGKNPYWGTDPFYMFEDGNFKIPSSYISDKYLEEVKRLIKDNPEAELYINSKNETVQSRQLVCKKASLKKKGKIIVLGHMDSKYNTPGALDNGAGVCILIAAAHMLKKKHIDFDVEFVPINSEEYFGATGELKYMEYLKSDKEDVKLVINIDSPGNIGSKNAVSYYNVDEKNKKIINNVIENSKDMCNGECWYSGDHMPFAAQGNQCIAITCSDFYSGGLKNTHSQNDTIDTVDVNLINNAAEFICRLILNYSNN